jgi:hypothetical protein
MNITQTIPKTETPEWVGEFFDGTRRGLEDFPFGQRLANVTPGDFLYLIHRGRIRGRLLITKVEQSPQTVRVGSQGRQVEAMTVVWVNCPGEDAGSRCIHREGHRGVRYDEVPEW